MYSPGAMAKEVQVRKARTDGKRGINYLLWAALLLRLSCLHQQRQINMGFLRDNSESNTEIWQVVLFSRSRAASGFVLAAKHTA